VFLWNVVDHLPDCAVLYKDAVRTANFQAFRATIKAVREKMVMIHPY
jgi:hypothetical protein